MLARSLAIVPLAFALAGTPGQLRSQTLPALTRVGAIRILTPDQARQARPVRLTGIVTALSGWKNSFFLQDFSAGISVDRTDNADVKAGDLVELTGVSNAGLFAPTILASYVRVVNHVPLPHARRVGYSDTFGGREDSQRIEVEGVVHAVRATKLFERDILLLNVALDGGEMRVLLQDFAGIDASRLIDSTVRVRGVCSTSFNQKRQFVGLAMFVPDRGDIDILQPANDNPFAAPATPLSNILQFGQTPHRVKVTGLVTYQIPGRALYLQDGHDGILIQSSSNELIQPGRRVEAVGFPSTGDYSPVLKDAAVRVVGHGNPVKPLRIKAHDVIVQKGGFLQVPYDDQLVQLQGKVAESHVQRGQRILILRQDLDVFEATLPLSLADAPEIEVGSSLLLTGICTVHAATDSDRTPLSFGILVRSPKDIAILENASWWTPTHARWVVLLLVISLLSLSGWLTIVRREDRLRALTVTDPLSGLYNRRGFFMLAERQWQSAVRKKDSMLLFYIDVNRFKEINDTHGHNEGDLALLTVAALLRECFRKTDIIARIGGDEFAVMATEDSVNSRALLERRLSKTLQQSNEKRGGTLHLSLSIGVLRCDNSMETLCIEDLLAQADGLMYQEKRRHHSGICEVTEQHLALA
jgi:diguanylate cyclase (GGDEF)-like protein